MSKKKHQLKIEDIIKIAKRKFSGLLQEFNKASLKQKVILFSSLFAVIVIIIGIVLTQQQKSVSTRATNRVGACTDDQKKCKVNQISKCLAGINQISCQSFTIDSLPEKRCVLGFHPVLGCESDDTCIGSIRGTNCEDINMDGIELEEKVCKINNPTYELLSGYLIYIQPNTCTNNQECRDWIKNQTEEGYYCDGSEDVDGNGTVNNDDLIFCTACTNSSPSPQPSTSPTPTLDPSASPTPRLSTSPTPTVDPSASPTPQLSTSPTPLVCTATCDNDQICASECGSEYKCSNSCQDYATCPDPDPGTCVRVETSCVKEGKLYSSEQDTEPIDHSCCEGLIPGKLSPDQQDGKLYCVKPESTNPPANRRCPLKIKGDADCNGKIDLVDFNEWRNEYRALVLNKKSTHTYNADGRGDVWDANFDGIIQAGTGYPTDLLDFNIWRENYRSR